MLIQSSFHKYHLHNTGLYPEEIERTERMESFNLVCVSTEKSVLLLFTF